MSITGKNPDNMELFYVTYPNYTNTKTYTVILSKKELQVELQRYNKILKIEKCLLTKGDEVDVEYLKPEKYKGKPYTYSEKYGK